MIKDLLLFLKVSRPIFWTLGIILFVLGMQISGGVWDWRAFVFLGFLTFPLNFIIYGLNDVYDYESDKLNPRKNTSQGQLLEKKYHRKIINLAWIFSIVFVVFSSFINWKVFLVSCVMVFSAYLYSVPPLRLKTQPPFDSVLNGLVYPTFMLSGLMFGDITIFPWEFYLMLVSTGFALHIYSTVVDYDYDKKVGDKTFAVKYGEKQSLLVSFFIFGLVLIFTNFQTNSLDYFLLVLFLFFLSELVFDIAWLRRYMVWVFAVLFFLLIAHWILFV